MLFEVYRLKSDFIGRNQNAKLLEAYRLKSDFENGNQSNKNLSRQVWIHDQFDICDKDLKNHHVK